MPDFDPEADRISERIGWLLHRRHQPITAAEFLQLAALERELDAAWKQAERRYRDWSTRFKQRMDELTAERQRDVGGSFLPVAGSAIGQQRPLRRL